MKSNKKTINEAEIAALVSKEVKKYLKENKDFDMVANLEKRLDEWNDWANELYEEMYKVKNQSWQEHDGRNIPELEHCFKYMKCVKTMQDMILPNIYSLISESKHGEKNSSEPQANNEL